MNEHPDSLRCIGKSISKFNLKFRNRTHFLHRDYFIHKAVRIFMEKLPQPQIITREGNIQTLEIGFGTRARREKKILREELKKIDEEFQKGI